MIKSIGSRGSRSSQEGNPSEHSECISRAASTDTQSSKTASRIKRWLSAAPRVVGILGLATLFVFGTQNGGELRAQSEEPATTYRIGVIATAGATRAIETWRATQDVLNQASAAQDMPFRFSIIPETSTSMADAISAGRVDLLLSDPAAFVVAEVDHGARAILSAARMTDGRSVDQMGALIFTRSDAPFEAIADLEDQRIMAVSHNDFGGWWLAAQEFRKFRFDPQTHLREILFSGGNEREVIYAVQSGLVEAGVVRASALEDLAAQGAISLDEFKPISLREFEGFDYWVSTPLYPERVLSALPNVIDEALSLVINTLLELENVDPSALESGRVVWQAPQNYQSVHELLISLQAPPYENYFFQAIVRIHAEYKWLIYGITIAIVGSLAFLAYEARRNFALAEASRNVLTSESRSKVFYRNAIEEHTVFCMLTRDGLISHVNNHFCELAGQERRALLGQKLADFLSEKDRQMLVGEIQEAMALKTPWNGHIRVQKGDQSVAWAQCTIIPVTGIDDQLSEVALVATDMTSTQQDVVEETFNDTLELIEDPVIVLRPETLTITYCNRAGAKLLIKDRVGGEWKDRPLAEVITGEDLNALRMRCEALIEGGQRRVTWEVDTRDERSYEISLEYVEPEMDAPSFVVMYRDVTERKAAERAKAEFVSTVSHELRTPLTSMKGALKMANSGLVGEVPDKMKDLLDMANRNTDRLVTLINDILDLEKIEAQKMVYNLEDVDMVEIIQQAVEANRFYAQRFNVTLVPKIDEEDGPYITKADRNRLMQVMDNLLSNASKFSLEGGEVDIGLFRHNGHIRMTVRDYGTGIPEGSQEKIFGKFVQSDSSDTRAKGGTGLGLAIVRPIIAAHNGDISFHSEENVGTEFFVDLPLVEGETVSEVTQTENLVVDAFSPSDKLDDDPVVSDSPLVQEFVKRLRRSGWGTEMDAGQVTTNQILNGSGVLGHAIAINLLDQDRRELLSELIELKVIENAPVNILEATLEADAEQAGNVDRLGTQVVSDWLRRVPKLVAQDEKRTPELKILLIADGGIKMTGGENLSVTRVNDASDVADRTATDVYDLVISQTETPKSCCTLIMPTETGQLYDDLPLTIFVGQKTKDDMSMGVVSKFSMPNAGRGRR